MGVVVWTILLMGVGILGILTHVIADESKELPLPSQRTWHASFQHALRNDGPECQDYHKQNDALDIDKLVDKYQLWPVLGRHTRAHTSFVPSTHNYNNRSVVYGLEHSLDEIYQHQHPTNCSDKLFMVVAPHEGGFGSVLHVYGAVLGLAMNLNRILLAHPYESNGWQFDTPHCKKPGDNNASSQGYRNFECYYEPWSSCTIYDALGPDAIKILTDQSKVKLQPFQLSHRVIGYLEEKEFIQRIKKDTDNQKTVLAIHNEHLLHGVVPNILMPMLQCSNVRKQMWFYWWRAISITYLMRLNNKTKEWLFQHRATNSTVSDYLKTTTAGASTLTGSTAANTIDTFDESKDIYSAIYVRRGDKEIEMKLVPTEEYLNATEI